MSYIRTRKTIVKFFLKCFKNSFYAIFIAKYFYYYYDYDSLGLLIFRAVANPRNSGISAKSREIPPKTKKSREIRQKYFQIHIGKTYLIPILAIRPVLFTPNVQIYLETSSLQRINNVPKLPGVFR